MSVIRSKFQCDDNGVGENYISDKTQKLNTLMFWAKISRLARYCNFSFNPLLMIFSDLGFPWLLLQVVSISEHMVRLGQIF